MLERLDSAMRQQKIFIADASHELRTPIAVAKSTLQATLAIPRSPEEYRQALQEATDDLRRMERLVDDLLTLAHLEENPSPMQSRELDLNELLKDVAEAALPRISSAGGRLVCELAPFHFTGDPEQLRRLFANLLDNALRHGPAGGEVRLTLRHQEGMAEILVHDEGGAISPEDLPYLFDRFYRADRSRSQSTGGIGLGLAIAKAIILRHGGAIRIESTVAAGTSVRVFLPDRPVTAPL